MEVIETWGQVLSVIFAIAFFIVGLVGPAVLGSLAQGYINDGYYQYTRANPIQKHRITSSIVLWTLVVLVYSLFISILVVIGGSPDVA